MARRPPPERKPYHLMSEEERRVAWASLRERRAHQATRHRRAPAVLGLLTVALFTLGLVLAHYRWPYAGFLLWAGVGVAGFAVIAFIRNLMGSISTRKDDLTPPGF